MINVILIKKTCMRLIAKQRHLCGMRAETKLLLQVQRKFCAKFGTRLTNTPTKNNYSSICIKVQEHNSPGPNKHIGNSERTWTSD